MSATHKKKVRRPGTAHPAAAKHRMFSSATQGSQTGQAAPFAPSPHLRLVPTTLEARLVALETANGELRRDLNRALGLLDQLAIAGGRIVASAGSAAAPEVASGFAAQPSVDPAPEDLGGESA